MSEIENVKIRRCHSLSVDIHNFFMLQSILFIYCFLCVAFLLLGPFLIIAGDWTYSGYFSSDIFEASFIPNDIIGNSFSPACNKLPDMVKTHKKEKEN